MEPQSVFEHHPQSLLALVAEHTKIDIDSNDSEVAVKHNEAARKLAAQAQKKGQDAVEQNGEEFASLFGQMTSNQLIVLAMLRKFEEAEGGKVSKTLRESVHIAKKLLAKDKTGVLEGVKIDEKKLSLGPGGLGDEDDQTRLENLVIDVFTVQVGLLMVPNLQPDGHVLAQTLPSAAHNVAKTAAHARRIVHLYSTLSPKLSSAPVTNDRVCIKIPSSYEGLQAMKILKEEGSEVKTLATAMFCVEQALAASENGNVRFMSPYVNGSRNHKEAAAGVPRGQRSFSVDTSVQTIYKIYKLLNKPERKQHWGYKTEVMPASFIDIEDVLGLVGVNRMTIGPPMLDKLATTRRTDKNKEGRVYEDLVKEALKNFQGPVDDPYPIKGDWFEGEKGELLKKALGGGRTKEMLDDALERFVEMGELELRKKSKKAIEESP